MIKRTLKMDMTVMALDDSLGNGQAEAGAAVTGRNKGVEDSIPVFHGNTRAAIAYMNPDFISMNRR